MKKLLIVAVTMILFTACPGQESGNSGKISGKVGICFPSELPRWVKDGNGISQLLRAKGATVQLRFADNDGNRQKSQITDFINADYDVIILAAANPNVLSDCLATAKAKDIKVICYDRLIMDTDAISYYITFNNFKVGVHQGEYIENALNLKNASGPFFMEFFTGDAGDPNVPLFFGGALSVLTPYIMSGKIACLSEQTTVQACATPGWSADNARNGMTGLITAIGYGPGTDSQNLDAVLCSNDSTAEGVITALLNAGYTAENMPVITGQDCDRTNVQWIIDGIQSMSVLKNTDIMIADTVAMVEAILTGSQVSVNDTTSYNNGSGYIESHLCDSSVVTADNWYQILIDSGYWDASDFTY